MVITMAKLRMAHASTHGARKPPGPITTTKMFLHISSSYTKILGETNFRTWEIHRSGSKAKDGKEERGKKKKKTKVGDKNGQATHGVRKPPGPIETTCR